MLTSHQGKPRHLVGQKVPHLPFMVSCSLHHAGIHHQISSELILPGAMRLWHELGNIPSFLAYCCFGQESRSIYLAGTTHHNGEMTSQPFFLLTHALANATLHLDAPFPSELTCWVSLDWPGLVLSSARSARLFQPVPHPCDLCYSNLIFCRPDTEDVSPGFHGAELSS